MKWIEKFMYACAGAAGVLASDSEWFKAGGFAVIYLICAAYLSFKIEKPPGSEETEGLGD